MQHLPSFCHWKTFSHLHDLSEMIESSLARTLPSLSAPLAAAYWMQWTHVTEVLASIPWLSLHLLLIILLSETLHSKLWRNWGKENIEYFSFNKIFKSLLQSCCVLHCTQFLLVVRTSVNIIFSRQSTCKMLVHAYKLYRFFTAWQKNG